MQPAVQELSKVGPLPGSTKPDITKLEKIESLLTQVKQPISDDEARVLVRLFGPDDCFGLAWTLLHIIEKAPGWPLFDALDVEDNEWIDLLRLRSENWLRQKFGNVF